MDLFEELEHLAINAADECGMDFEPDKDEITRWQKLFTYTYDQAVERITKQKNDFSRSKISDDLWDMVKSHKEAQGYSRNAYEHEIMIGTSPVASHDRRLVSGTPVAQAETAYLVLLEGVLNTPETIQAIAKLAKPPEAVRASSETKDSIFCRIDDDIKKAILTWLSEQKSNLKPTFVRLSKAKKDLAATSLCPTLGIESTLPQYRSPLAQTSYSPLQDEYPVWYFFYGTLSNSDFLRSLLSLPDDERPVLIPASISGGKIEIWQKKYNALVDGAFTDYVHGSAYEVTTKQREEALLLYETEKYEVVRCHITMEMRTVQGLTFRFAGPLSSL